MSSKERQTADAIVVAFNSMDIDAILGFRTPDCQRVILPASLNIAPQSNSAYRANLAAMNGIFTSFKLAVHDVIEGTSSTSGESTEDQGASTVHEKKKIVMYISARGDTPVGEYKNEYVWKMGFEDGGERVCEWVEYVDVGMARDFYPLLKAEMIRRAQEGSAPAGKN
ncbi:hypothetical protein IQ07DRAFT_585887 [Pyrenochaeta sp. DS3sAY3a]|nr:hypothetical protein IQ07DRAFT_585887 [Pyrenochaeta sp. DS3sAY3a]